MTLYLVCVKWTRNDGKGHTDEMIGAPIAAYTDVAMANNRVLNDPSLAMTCLDVSFMMWTGDK